MKKLKAFFRRFTGVSTPFVGVSWQPDQTPDLKKEEADRWDDIQKSLHEFRLFFRGEKGHYLVGLRVPNTTPNAFTVRKVIVTNTNSQNFLLNLFCHVQLDGTAVQGDGGPSWTLPGHLAGLWEMPGGGDDQKDLTIGNVLFEIEFRISSGASCLHKLQINTSDMSEDTRGFLEWGKTMRDIDGRTITQSTSDGNVDMKLTKPLEVGKE